MRDSCHFIKCAHNILSKRREAVTFHSFIKSLKAHVKLITSHRRVRQQLNETKHSPFNDFSGNRGYDLYGRVQSYRPIVKCKVLCSVSQKLYSFTEFGDGSSRCLVGN